MVTPDRFQDLRTTLLLIWVNYSHVFFISIAPGKSLGANEAGETSLSTVYCSNVTL